MNRIPKTIFLAAFSVLIATSACTESKTKSIQEETEIRQMDSTSKAVKENTKELDNQTRKVEESLEKLDKEFDNKN